MEDGDIGLLRPENLPLTTTELIIVAMMEEVDIGLKIPATIPIVIVEFIILVKLVEVDLGLKRPDTLSLEIADQELIPTGWVDIGLIPATIPPNTQVLVVDC